MTEDDPHIRLVHTQACRPWGCRGYHGTPRFWQISYPTSTKGCRLCSPDNTGTPRFSDLPTALTYLRMQMSPPFKFDDDEWHNAPLPFH